MLLDISRNSLVFETMEDLTICLRNIATDENVRVERLKNRMSPSHPSRETGGFRDVVINLKVTNEEAVSLGAELTVCEVRLMLVDFCNVRTEDGHKGFMTARRGRKLY
mmetsp:Transcript_25702/g.64803  ORF Transcript_25702/g.64803 Transcript_25702/m.64803 type:complete len:108 (+) Transcript_25702:177-500(+)